MSLRFLAWENKSLSYPTDFGSLSSIDSCASDVSRCFIENALLINSIIGWAYCFSGSLLSARGWYIAILCCCTWNKFWLIDWAKTEAVTFGTSQRLLQVSKSQGVHVAGTHVQFADDVKLLRVTLDSTLYFNKHVVDVTRSCHYHMTALCHIRPLLPFDSAKAMAVSIVSNRLEH